MSLLRLPSALVAMTLSSVQDLPAQDTSALYGRWESASTSRGGIGQTLEFTAGGDLIAITGVLINGKYHTDGSRLIRRVPDDTNDLVVQFRVHGDTLLQWVPAAADTQRMYRTALSTSRAGITGQWSYTHYTGATAFEHYTTDGRWRFRLPSRSDTSSYEVRGDSIFVRGGVLAGRYRWSLGNDTLSLESLDPAGPAARYVRVQQR